MKNTTTLMLTACFLFLLWPFGNNANAEESKYFDCKANHAFLMRDGTLKEIPSMTKIGIRFQQRTENSGVLATGIKTPWSETTLKVQYNTAEGLLAIGGGEGPSSSPLMFRISSIEPSTSFVLMNGNIDGSVFLGTCEKVSVPAH
jgi:hypothetical protein